MVQLQVDYALIEAFGGIGLLGEVICNPGAQQVGHRLERIGHGQLAELRRSLIVFFLVDENQCAGNLGVNVVFIIVERAVNGGQSLVVLTHRTLNQRSHGGIVAEVVGLHVGRRQGLLGIVESLFELAESVVTFGQRAEQAGIVIEIVVDDILEVGNGGLIVEMSGGD